ncbi:MAG: glutamyl-tRNA reductase [Bacteroidetes bacterium]|nr:glutamyl-tRNA reductase [Bacteroidota bacterium]
MQGNSVKDITHFFVAGINYKKTDAALRGQFAINNEQYTSILSLAPSFGLHEFFILSTCNRTEIYGFSDDASRLVNLVCTQTAGTADVFDSMAYVKNGVEAIDHLFNVAAGIDSQILGDYEIVGQLKLAVRFAKEQGFVGTMLDRIVNAVLQSSKAIKNQTSLSGGTVSVSFAAVQYIREKVTRPENSRILLVGTGKIGSNTCRNLVDYLGTTNITLVNRTPDKAQELAAEMGLQQAPMTELAEQIAKADIILVATNAAQPTILKADLEGQSEKLIIDLSIPYNVEAAAQHLPNIRLVSVDELSRINDETLQKREAEVPQAKAIIAGHMADLLEWYEMRQHVPVLTAVKNKLLEMDSCQLYGSYFAQQSTTTLAKDKPEARIQRIINVMAVKMRRQNQRGCHYIEAINDYMATGIN